MWKTFGKFNGAASNSFVSVKDSPLINLRPYFASNVWFYIYCETCTRIEGSSGSKILSIHEPLLKIQKILWSEDICNCVPMMGVNSREKCV